MELTEILIIVFAIIASIVAVILAVILVFCLSKRCGQRKQNAREVRNKDYDVEAQRENNPGPSYPYSQLANPPFPGYIQQNRPQSVKSSLRNKTPAKSALSNPYNTNVDKQTKRFNINNADYQNARRSSEQQPQRLPQPPPAAKTATIFTINSDFHKHQEEQRCAQPRASRSETRLPVNIIQPASTKKIDNSGGKSIDYARLDLHHFKLKDAMDYFKAFLTEALKVYESYRNSNSNRMYRFIEVITGRGNHSPNNVPVIKPAVEDYLQKHQYKFVWANPGKVRIDLMSAFRSEA